MTQNRTGKRQNEKGKRQNRFLFLPFTFYFLLFTFCFAAGCAQQRPYTRLDLFRVKDEAPEKVIYCNDCTGQVPGSIPFVLGGTCCCTPTQELIDAYHRDGLLLDYDLGRLKQLYESLGIQIMDGQHHDCNNQCPWGPHILQGGKCMVPPTPGTRHYEEIITGRFRLPEPEHEDTKRR